MEKELRVIYSGISHYQFIWVSILLLHVLFCRWDAEIVLNCGSLCKAKLEKREQQYGIPASIQFSSFRIMPVQAKEVMVPQKQLVGQQGSSGLS